MFDLFSDPKALALLGLPLYFFYVWFVWSNRKDAGGRRTFKRENYLQRQEYIAVFIGSLIFYFEGQGVFNSVCDVSEYFLGEKGHDVCIDIMTNNEGLLYLLSGSLFSFIVIFFVKLMKRKAKKKLEG